MIVFLTNSWIFVNNIYYYCEKKFNSKFPVVYLFSEKLAEATRKYATLHSELKSALNEDTKPKLINFRKGERKSPIAPRKLQDLKLAFSEFYLSLILLQNYQTLNNTGFRKILKKHDKVF